MRRIGIFGLVAWALLSASPGTAQETEPIEVTPADETAPGPAATPAQQKAQEAAARQARRDAINAAAQAQADQEAQLRQWYYSQDARAVRLQYDPVRCAQYERTGGPIAGTVVGAVLLGAGAGLAGASNGDKVFLGVGVAMAIVGLASTAASGAVLAERKKARYQQALAGCPVIAK